MIKATRYAQTQVMTASPARLLQLLLRACRKHLATAARLLEEGEGFQAQEPLHKASEIVFELCRTLDPNQAKDLAENLADVYANVSARILRAMTSHQAHHVREAEQIFGPVADAFEDVINGELERESTTPPQEASNAEGVAGAPIGEVRP